LTEVEVEVFWWLVGKGGRWTPVCRQHSDCLKAYGSRLGAAKRLAGGGGVWGSPLRGHRGHEDIEAIYEHGRYYFRWIPHPALVAIEQLAQACT